MLIPAIVTSTDELLQILHLQQENLRQNISETERIGEGFVTLEHTLPILEIMHQFAPSVIIKDNNKVVAYALTQIPECRDLMPALVPMFALLNTLSWNNHALTNFRYYVMGQVCIAKEYRGQGVFEQLYHHHRKVYQSRYDLFLTQISVRNPRSIRAHEKVGFRTIHKHRDEKDEWLVVAWDWGSR